jgi:hypothetical protein
MVVSGESHAPTASSPEKNARYPFSLKFGGPQIRYRRFLEKRKSLLLEGIGIPDSPARSLVAIPTTPSRSRHNKQSRELP